MNSVLTPSTKGSVDTTNEPITEEEILAVFSKSVFISEEPEIKLSSTSCITKTEAKPSSLTSQLLLLYYLLLYEDTRLSNMKTILLSDRKVKRYSPQFIAKIPIFYLLQKAQKDQEQFAGLFSPLLRLLTTHFPHLCLVQSWLADEEDADFDLKNCRVKLLNWPPEGFTRESLNKGLYVLFLKHDCFMRLIYFNRCIEEFCSFALSFVILGLLLQIHIVRSFT